MIDPLTDGIFILLGFLLLLLVVLPFVYFGKSEMFVNSFIQSFRWILVGAIVIKIEDVMTEQDPGGTMFLLVVFVLFLTVSDYYLRFTEEGNSFSDLNFEVKFSFIIFLVSGGVVWYVSNAAFGLIVGWIVVVAFLILYNILLPDGIGAREEPEGDRSE